MSTVLLENGIEKLREQIAPVALDANGSIAISVRTLNQFSVDPETNGGCLLGNRWLCRGGGCLLAAPTGIGKSVFAMQAAILWALERPCFGIRPSGKQRSLIIQAENDDGDIAKMRDGIFRGLNLSAEDRAAACKAIQIVCESSATGERFIELTAEMVAKHKPDLLWIDPLFAYLGDSVNEQKAVSVFLRNGLNPILQAHGCGLILIHHTNKPQSGKEKPKWEAGDHAYLGAGTAEFANWARAVIAIRSLGTHTIFEAVLGKRGKRAGLVDDEGKPRYSFFIKHGATGICWELVADDDLTPQGKTAQPGVEDVFSLIPLKGDISQAKLFNAATKIIGQGRLRNCLKELAEDKKMFIWRTKRSGTGPALSYSRHEQKLL